MDHQQSGKEKLPSAKTLFDGFKSEQLLYLGHADGDSGAQNCLAVKDKEFLRRKSAP